MTNLMTSTKHINHSSTDSEFFELVRDLDAVGSVNPWQQRAIEWARLAARLEAAGAKITIGSPS